MKKLLVCQLFMPIVAGAMTQVTDTSAPVSVSACVPVSAHIGQQLEYQVVMPAADVLRARLGQFKYLGEKTRLLEVLQNKKLSISYFVGLVGCALCDYCELMQNSTRTISLIKAARPDIIRRLVDNDARAIQELEKEGLLG